MARTVSSSTATRNGGSQHSASMPMSPPSVAPVELSLGSSPRRRSWSSVGVGVLLVAVAGLLAAWVFASTGQHAAVLVAARDVAPGEVLRAGDVAVVEVGSTGSGIAALPPSRSGEVVGLVARGPVPKGTVLHAGLFVSRERSVPAGMAVVSAALEQGAAPVGAMAAGDRVELVGTVPTGARPGDGAGPQVLTLGTVWSIQTPASGAAASGKVVVTVLVPADTVPMVAQAAAEGRLRVGLVSP